MMYAVNVSVAGYRLSLAGKMTALDTSAVPFTYTTHHISTHMHINGVMAVSAQFVG